MYTTRSVWPVGLWFGMQNKGARLDVRNLIIQARNLASTLGVGCRCSEAQSSRSMPTRNCFRPAFAAKAVL